MDGHTIREYMANEMKAMFDSYRNFETLIPSSTCQGADHRGEDGRYVESLIRDCLKRHLPKELEVLTGFIVRPAVKTGAMGHERDGDKDQHSSQLDIIIHNSAKYPIYHRFEDNSVIVPPEGVIGIISVKKNFHPDDIEQELYSLSEASKLCRDNRLRGPFLALVAMDSHIERRDIFSWIFERMNKVYEKDDIAFEDMVGYVSAFLKWGIFKNRPTGDGLTAKYVKYIHNEEDYHFGLQHLLTGILSVYYDPTRSNLGRPGFTAFPEDRPADGKIGTIQAKIPAKKGTYDYSR